MAHGGILSPWGVLHYYTLEKKNRSYDWWWEFSPTNLFPQFRFNNLRFKRAPLREILSPMGCNI